MSSPLDSIVDRVLWSLIAEWAISTGEAKERAAAHVNRYVSFLMTEPSIHRAAMTAAQANVCIGIDQASGPDKTSYMTSEGGKLRPSTPNEIAAAQNTGETYWTPDEAKFVTMTTKSTEQRDETPEEVAAANAKPCVDCGAPAMAKSSRCVKCIDKSWDAAVGKPTPQSAELPPIDHSTPLGFQVRARRFIEHQMHTGAPEMIERLAHEFAAIEREAFKRGLEQRDTRPRGRRLTDGEAVKLFNLAAAWHLENSEPSKAWKSVEFYVESLLAPTDEVPSSLPDGSLISELFHKLWGIAATGKVYDKSSWKQLQRLLEMRERQSATVPTDEVRVALGEVTLGFGSSCWVDVASNSLFLSSKTDDALTAALSASPGDRFEFDVCARRVK